MFWQGRAQCPVASVLCLPCYLMKINSHYLEKCTSRALFCPDFMHIWWRECRLPLRIFVAFHAVYAGYFPIGVTLWSLLKLKFSGLGLVLLWDACPLQILLLLVFLRLLSFLSCLHIFSPTSFPQTILETSREVEGIVDMEENEIITEKKCCPRVVPDSPELGQQSSLGL